MPDFHTSMVDISRVGKMENLSGSTANISGSGVSGGSSKPSAKEKVKKKGGIFSFLRRDKKSSSQVRELVSLYLTN